MFWYGQTYMLGVEAWLAAPLMAVAGATVTALKLPLLAINVAIAWLLFLGLTRETGLDDARAAFATLFFVLAAPITSAHFLTANGGNVEPALYVLLLWMLRRRPVWMGIVLGIGFLNREFTIYGAAALLLLDAWSKQLFTRAVATGTASPSAPPAAVWIVFLGLRQILLSRRPRDVDGRPGRAARRQQPAADRGAAVPRSAGAIVSGIGGIFTSHWPTLFGLTPQPLTDFGIESAVQQGLPRSCLAAPARSSRIPASGCDRDSDVLRRPTSGPRTSDFCVYLVLVARPFAAGLLVGRCGIVDFYTMRYELLSVLGALAWPAGIFGRTLATVARLWWRPAPLSSCCRSRPTPGCWPNTSTRPPVAAKQELIAALDARGIRYAYADYWTAYYVSFMTRERIVVASD